MERKNLVFWSLFSFLAFAISLTLLKIVLRTLPVHEGTYRLSVNEKNPVLPFKPNRAFLWSKGWNFEIVNHVRANNFGFINNTDYSTDSRLPLLTIIGDSYVEAIMLPFQQTVKGRLASHLQNSARVYSLGVSGTALSQYLTFSAYAKEMFQPDAMVVVIIGNDFDESLKKYRWAPGLHQFVEGSDGEMKLERVDYSPSRLSRLSRRLALGRYLGINLQLPTCLNRLGMLGTQENWTSDFVGNTSSSIDSMRVRDSQRAIEAFLSTLPTSSGLNPPQIMFVVDGMRPHLYYSEDMLKSAQGSYFDLMRQYFIPQAKEKGYEVVDMQTIFRDHYTQYGKRFEFPNDMHWNALGHELVLKPLPKQLSFLNCPFRGDIILTVTV